MSRRPLGSGKRNAMEEHGEEGRKVSRDRARAPRRKSGYYGPRVSTSSWGQWEPWRM